MPRGFFLAALSLLAGAIPLRAETAGEIRGRVLDEAGASLPGMTVMVESRKAGISGRGALTDAAGAFRVPALPPASDYRVKASGAGRTVVIISEVEVVAGRPTALTITLPTESALREQVKVRATPPVVNPEETSTTTRFSSEFVDSLPILGRDYQDVLVLAPGVTDVDGDGNPNIHGARDTDTLTVVDGVTTTDPLTGKMGAQLNIESIQEIEVKTTGASAEFGRAQGGTVNILTKSGGNDFAGSFKFYWRGSALDGDGAGEDDPRLHGGLGDIGLRDLTFNDYLPFLSMGGPMVKDRAWYYMTFEYISKQDPVNALTTAFVTGIREWRQFGKFTWQATPSQRVALSVNHDPQKFLNQGLNSLTAEETGFTIGAGGILLALRDTAVVSPTVALEGTIGWFEGQPNFVPNLGPDTNENGVLFTPRNGDTFDQAFERDSGEDYDGDGRFDVFEDYIANGHLDYQEACIYYDRHPRRGLRPRSPPDTAGWLRGTDARGPGLRRAPRPHQRGQEPQRSSRHGRGSGRRRAAGSRDRGSQQQQGAGRRSVPDHHLSVRTPQAVRLRSGLHGRPDAGHRQRAVLRELRRSAHARHAARRPHAVRDRLWNARPEDGIPDGTRGVPPRHRRQRHRRIARSGLHHRPARRSI